ncbi:hypothetical protein J437_LFUL016690, partial [Ladona fulva]
METSSLNLAHQQHRRAEAHLRCRRFDEAIQCHKEASRLLEEAMKLTTVTKALESLKLQREYHIQQESIIRMKANCYEKNMKAIENNHHKMVSEIDLHEAPKRDVSHNLQVEIYRKIEEADSLLQILLKRGVNEDESLKVKLNGQSDKVSVPEQESVICVKPTDKQPIAHGNKLPKNDQTVIEELKVINEQLRSQVLYKI